MSAVGAGIAQRCTPQLCLLRCGALVALATVVLGVGPCLTLESTAQGGEVRPSIVLVMTDDQNYRSVSRMPYLQSRPWWFRFDNAFINNPLCCPSRATILTGRYSHHTGVETNSEGQRMEDDSTIATWLDDHGYRTGLFGKYLNFFPFGRGSDYIPPGWDKWAEAADGGKYFEWTLNQDGDRKRYGSDASDYSTDALARKAARFIRDTRQSKPVFVHFSPKAPHDPTTPAPRHEGLFANEPIAHLPSFNEDDVSDKPEYIRDRGKLDVDQVEERQRDEYETLQAVDEGLARIVRALKDEKRLDDSMVIFMTDNSVGRGEHRWSGGKRCEYEDCVRTPLLIKFPRHEGGRSGELVSNVDLAPTMAAVAGATPGHKVDGHSLSPLAEGRADSWRSGVLLRTKASEDVPEPPTFWAVRTARYKYVELKTGERELYDLKLDPFELENVVDAPGYADVRRDLAEELGRLKDERPHDP